MRSQRFWRKPTPNTLTPWLLVLLLAFPLPGGSCLSEDEANQPGTTQALDWAGVESVKQPVIELKSRRTLNSKTFLQNGLLRERRSPCQPSHFKPHRNSSPT